MTEQLPTELTSALELAQQRIDSARNIRSDADDAVDEVLLTMSPQELQELADRRPQDGLGAITLHFVAETQQRAAKDIDPEAERAYGTLADLFSTRIMRHVDEVSAPTSIFNALEWAEESATHVDVLFSEACRQMNEIVHALTPRELADVASSMNREHILSLLQSAIWQRDAALALNRPTEAAAYTETIDVIQAINVKYMNALD